ESVELGARTRDQLARLNLRAGCRALAAGAPGTARIYLSVAGKLLDTIGPELDHEPRRLLLDVQLNLALAEALSLEAKVADARLASLLARELSPIERGEIAIVRCKICQIDARLDRALAVAFAGLDALGIEVPRTPTTVDTVRML